MPLTVGGAPPDTERAIPGKLSPARTLSLAHANWPDPARDGHDHQVSRNGVPS